MLCVRTITLSVFGQICGMKLCLFTVYAKENHAYLQNYLKHEYLSRFANEIGNILHAELGAQMGSFGLLDLVQVFF